MIKTSPKDIYLAICEGLDIVCNGTLYSFDDILKEITPRSLTYNNFVKWFNKQKCCKVEVYKNE